MARIASPHQVIVRRVGATDGVTGNNTLNAGELFENSGINSRLRCGPAPFHEIQ